MILRSINYKAPQRSDFPYSLFSDDFVLQFSSSVTFLVGENGTGKSTLLEGIAASINAITVGSSSIDADNSFKAGKSFGPHLHAQWSLKANRGFFLRAEDFFGFVKNIAQLKSELQEQQQQFESELSGYGRDLAVGSIVGQIKSLEQKYGSDLDAYSHGEGFLKLFQSRLVPQGLYLLDEPEAPLSPKRQLALITMMKEQVAQGSQFIIATHSPVLMAFPEAQILEFKDGKFTAIDYVDVEHVAITKSFLQNPTTYLQRL